MRSRRFILLSLLLGATVFAWILSYPLGIAMQWSRVYRDGNTLQVRARLFEYGDGELRLEWGGMRVAPREVWVSSQIEQQWRRSFPPFKTLKPRVNSWGPGAWTVGGFGVFHALNNISGDTAFGIPFWFPAFLFSIVPIRVALRRWLAVDRRRRGLCPGCGYDLRATSGICPECGGLPESQVLASECGPAIIATARSTGTIGVVILAAYFTVATILVVQSLIHWQAPLLVRGLVIAGAMVLVLTGSFHAAGYSRSGEALFGFGALAGSLLLPVYTLPC